MVKETCRFYEKRFPDKDEVVMVNVRSIAEMGAYVSLLEYDGIEGMILLSELSRRRIRSIARLIRVGRNEAVMVLRVDEDKGYIDLSKRRVSPEDVKACDDKYQKNKAVNSILRHVAELCDAKLEDLYERTAWKLVAAYGTQYEAFRKALTEPEEVMGKLDLDEKTSACLLQQISRRLASQPSKIRADIDVHCWTSEGVEAVKDALRAGIAVGTEAAPVKVNLIAPPLYAVTTMSTDKDEGIKAVNKAVDAIKDRIATNGGSLSVIKEARAINELEEQKLQEEIENEDEVEEEETGENGEVIGV
ncbi:hypothetical protein SARC_01291 [Sphaeroforma arctica JP610]|uniref:S1 motif domain-containing protein n=1 Tax=Sphaeroforma arctica JP610 TaxID=667725 RepID=A0A0L0GEB4_9EUKA|nr:hypothetical protein SARC_01291 [Sphaeroforma arctica JP610]KNC86568.1 hypothetical protein SARC_01291 [Sphaeroforma arctica JP610]|eukprot:XP_014160470.1 hypothetical protein SARC_01291 [Sphaeroforma arctica JP610]